VSSTDKPVHKPVIPPLIGLAGGIVAVSTASLFIRFAQNYAPSLVIAACRLLLATILIAPWALGKYRSEILDIGRKDLLLTLLSGFFLALHFAAWITSLGLTTVTSSVVLVTTSSLWVALLSPIVLKEKVITPVKIGLAFALIGSTIVSFSDIKNISSGDSLLIFFRHLLDQKAFIGNLLALVGAWLAAGYLLIGRKLRSRMSLVAYTFVVYGFAAMVLVVMALIMGYSLVGYPTEAYGWFLALAVIPQLLGHSTFNWALKYLSVSFVSISLLGEPIGSTILAVIFLHEVPTLVKIIGAILILGGILIATRDGSVSRSDNVD
jgi:drug/metabolite transporter (DMT)-like permease